jgi:TP901 family phage tail tape measure protein
MSGVASWKAKIELDIEDLRKQLLNAENSIDQVTKEDRKIKLDLDTKTLESVIRKLDTMLDSIGNGTNNFKQFENLSAQLSSVTKDISNIGKAFSSMNDGTELVNNIKSINTSLTTLSNHFASEVSGRMSTSIKDIKSTLSDVGDGDELTPLLQIINNIESAINELSSSVKGIGLNMNIDFGSDTEMESKAQAKISNALQAYQRLFDHIKISGVGGQIITDKFFDFDINQYDTSMSKLQAYIKFIENMRNEAKQMFNGQDVLKSDTDKAYWTQASSAMAQVTKTFNEMKAATDTNPLENIFGKTELTEVIAQLGSIASKLDEISNSAKNFANAFNGGLDVTASVQEVTDLTNRVKELEAELVKIKGTNVTTSQVESNILNGHSENAESANVRKYKRVDNGIPAVDVGNHDNEIKVSSRTELEQALKSLQAEIIASINTSTSFVKEVTDFYDSQDKLVKTQMKVSDNSGNMRTYTTSYSKDKDGNATAWTSHIDTQKFTNQSKEELEVQKQITAEIEAQSKANQKKYQEFQREEQAYRKEQNQIAYDKLTETIRQYSEVAKRVSSGRVEDGDLQKMTQLEEKISQLQKQPILSESQVAKSESFLNNLYDQLDKIEKKLQETNQQKVGNGLEKLSTYRGKSDKYSDTLKKFNDGGWASDEYIKNVNTVSEALKTYQAALQDVGTHELITSKDIDLLDKYESELKQAISAVQNMTAAQKGYDQLAGEKELNKISQILRENSNMSEKAKAEIRDYYHQIESGNPSASLGVIHGKILDIVNAEEQAGRAGKSLWDIFKTSRLHQMVAQVAGMFSFYDAINGVKRGVSTVKELNTALTEMRKVSDESLQSLKNYQAATFDTADDVGTTAKQIQNSTADWMRLGESMDQAAESAKDANILLNVSEFEGIDEATESLVSMSQAYQDLDKMDIIDVLNNIGNNYSISTDGLATALKDSASALVTANNDLNEAVSLTTAGNAITQDPSKVGAGLRTISLRLVGTEEAKQELSDLGEETDGMITTVSKLRDTIMNATKAASSDGKGFDILDANGNYKSTYEIMQGLADLYDDIVKKDKELSTNNLNLLLETIAGKNRSNIAASILQNGDMLRSVYEDAQNSEGSAEKELNSYLDSVDGKLQQLTNRAQEFWFKVIDSETIKNGIDLSSTLLKGVTDFVDKVGILRTAFIGLAGYLTAKNANKLGYTSI